MTSPAGMAIVSTVARHPHPDNELLRVVVAGGGVGGLEVLIALRALAGEHVALTLVTPEDDFTVRALDAFEPFGLGRAQRYPLAELAADLDATLRRDAVARVERDDRTVRLQSGDELAYDVLVLAVGAFPYPAYDHGVCFERAHDADALDELVADLRAGLAPRIAIVVPPGCAWTLPAYELALMVAARAKPTELTLVTAEHEPLSAFGAPAAELARTELEAAGVELVVGVRASVPHPTVVQLAPSARLACDRVIHLPLLSGPNCPGVPCDASGFILVDDAFRARDADDLYAVGDATAGSLKQGGLATQQADVVAEHIAWRAGADHPPRTYRPVLRGLLRTSHGVRYLRAEPPGGAISAEVSDTCLWWPASKVAARWLTPWLAARDVAKRPMPEPRRLPSGGLSWTLTG
ncbi:MAG TPA: FAD-dependent oxidoreductase [Solirubrobacteraceae bacterium]